MSEFDEFGIHGALTPDTGGAIVTEYLHAKGVEFSTFHIEPGISLQEICSLYGWPGSSLMRAKVLHDDNGKLLVITSADYILDYPAICMGLERDLEVFVATDDPISRYYDDNFRSYAPIPGLLALPCAVSVSFKPNDDPDKAIYFPAGQDNMIISVTLRDYLQLLDKSWDKAIAIPCITKNKVIEKAPDVNGWLDNINNSFISRRFKKRVIETFELPTMPQMADELLKLRVDPSSDSKLLANLIEQDPSLSAQLISWALSPYYNYPGKITSVEDAIIKVLGYDLVMNIGLGLALSQIIRVPEKGAFGLHSYWLHSLYSAAFIEKLLPHVDNDEKSYRGLAYLCGLLHNFGHLLLGHLAPPQLHNLNQMWELNPAYPILQLEELLFKVNHEEIGCWLMEAWHMPEEIVLAVANHHNNEYSGKHASYIQLVFIADQLLARQSIGDGCKYIEIPEEYYNNLGLTEDKVNSVFNDFWSHKEGLLKIVTDIINK